MEGNLLNSVCTTCIKINYKYVRGSVHQLITLLTGILNTEMTYIPTLVLRL